MLHGSGHPSRRLLLPARSHALPTARLPRHRPPLHPHPLPPLHPFPDLSRPRGSARHQLLLLPGRLHRRIDEPRLRLVDVRRQQVMCSHRHAVVRAVVSGRG